MSLIVLYLGTRYDVCECNSLRHMTISSFFVSFDLRLWPLSSVKVTSIFIIRWTLYCCVLVPNKKCVGSIEFDIWTIVWRKLKWRHNYVISIYKYRKTEIWIRIKSLVLSNNSFSGSNSHFFWALIEQLKPSFRLPCTVQTCVQPRVLQPELFAHQRSSIRWLMLN